MRAVDDEEPDRAFYEMEACVSMPLNVTECFRSGITVYAIPDPIGMGDVHVTSLNYQCMLLYDYITTKGT